MLHGNNCCCRCGPGLCRAAKLGHLLMQVWALKSYTKSVPLYIQVLQRSSLALIAPFLDPEQDVIVSAEQTRHRLLALSCLCPGASTLIGECCMANNAQLVHLVLQLMCSAETSRTPICKWSASSPCSCPDAHTSINETPGARGCCIALPCRLPPVWQVANAQRGRLQCQVFKWH